MRYLTVKEFLLKFKNSKDLIILSKLGKYNLRDNTCIVKVEWDESAKILKWMDEMGQWSIYHDLTEESIMKAMPCQYVRGRITSVGMKE